MAWSEAGIGILAMAVTTYLIRAIPLVFFTKKITNRHVRAFLYYVPYAVLASMTVPGVFMASPSLASAIAGTAAACLLAWHDKGLLIVSVGAAAASLLALLFA